MMEAIKLNDPFFTEILSESNSFDVQKSLIESKINPLDEIETQTPCLQFTCEVKLVRSNVATLGNFSLIIGKAKSKKSFFINLIVANVLKGTANESEFIRGQLPIDKQKVVYFDTEQGKSHVQKAVRRICTQLNDVNPENLTVFCLRKFKPSERLEMIETYLYANEDIGFVVIDGIKDLVTSINDEEQACMVTSKLLKWTEERQIHIVTVLHQNKGDNNARGHLGTELVNKAETVLSVTKSTENKDVSIVDAEYCRDAEPEPFAISVDEHGMPFIMGDWIEPDSKTSNPSKRIQPDQIPLKDYVKILNEVFDYKAELKYAELQIQIDLALHKFLDLDLGVAKIKKLITYVQNNKLIEKIGKDKSPNSFYILAERPIENT